MLAFYGLPSPKEAYRPSVEARMSLPVCHEGVPFEHVRMPAKLLSSLLENTYVRNFSFGTTLAVVEAFNGRLPHSVIVILEFDVAR